jgi:hypothetical protein
LKLPKLNLSLIIGLTILSYVVLFLALKFGTEKEKKVALAIAVVSPFPPFP